MRELESRYATRSLLTSSTPNTLSRDLTRRKLDIEADVFNQYDLDGDGRLDRGELRKLVRHPTPTLELVVRLGTRNDGEPVVDLLGSPKKQNISIRRSSGGLASLVVDDVQIEIADVAASPGIARQYLARQFGAADRDGNNYVDEQEAQNSNAFRASFTEFDEDGDGKLFEKELTAVVDDRTKAARSRTRMNVRNRGRDLFEILDLDRNRRLGRRELAQAVTRIELWDTNNDGAISQSEIPQLYQVSFGPGQPQFRGVQIPGQTTRSTDDSSTNPAVAPKWFTKLDRNGDGELARREFPGTRAEFEKLDENSDGVVDVEEAELVQ